MKVKAFGKTGATVSVIGQGTWNVAESGAQLEAAKAALKRGIELGMTHIDTAEMYGAGNVERVVAAALKGVPRERYFLVSKALPSHATFDGIARACEASLKRLDASYLDCYLLHWPSEVALQETMRGLEALVERGLCRSVGVSNFDSGDMLEAQSYLRNVPLACNQVLYHLRERGIEHQLIETAAENEIAVVAYTPFGRGRMPSAQQAVLERIAQRHGVGAHAIALAFLTRHDNVFAIPKASSAAHQEQNAAAGDLKLSDQDVAAIEDAFPIGPRGPLATI